MSLKEEHKLKFKNADDLINKIKRLSQQERKTKVFTGDVTVTIQKDDEINENNKRLTYENNQTDEQTRKNIEILHRIRNRGKNLNKEAISELYRIGQREDEDWEDDKS